jgi:Glycosyltransferase 61
MQPCRFSSFLFFVNSSWHKNRRILLVVASILVLVVSPLMQFRSLDGYNLQNRPNTASFGTNTSETTTPLNKTLHFSSFSSATTVESSTSTTVLQTSRKVPSSASCNVTLSVGPLLYTTYPAHYNLADFLKGKGVSLPNHHKPQPKEEDANAQNANSASSSTSSSIICKYFYKGKDSPHHFPHTMQIMFRCWSWWYGQWWRQVVSSSLLLSSSTTTRRNSHLLLLGNTDDRQPLPSSFIFAVPSNWTLPYLTEQTPYPYNRGFFNAIQEFANVSIQLMPSPITLADATKTDSTDHHSSATTSTTSTTSSTTPAPNNKIVRPYLHPDFPFQGQSPDHFHALRDIILAGLEQRQQQQQRHKRPFSTAQQNPNPYAPLPRIAIVNREGSRKILNALEIAHEVESRLSAWTRVKAEEPASVVPPPTTTTRLSIRIVTMEDWSFEEQIQFFSTVDVLISPHGAQLTSIPFLPNGASVLEVFPLGYEQHAFFGTLAAICGVTHAYTYLSQGDRNQEVQAGMINLPTRIQRRSAQLCPALTDLSDFIVTLVEQWQERQRQPPQL